MKIDYTSDEIGLTDQEIEEIEKLKQGDIITFRGNEYLFLGKKDKEIHWTLLA